MADAAGHDNARRSAHGERLRRGAPAAIAAGVCAWLIVRMAWESGGYFPPSYLFTGVVAFGVCAVLLVALRPRYGLSTQALVALSALSGLAAWTGVSSLWSPAPSLAVEAMQRDLSYLGLFALALVAVGSGRYARHVVWGVLAVICLVCGAALVARLAPDLIREPATAFGTFRLSYPLTYWNALGALAAMGAVLAFGLAADPKSHYVLRAVSGALAVALTTTMYLSLSRGAWMALFAGLAALAALGAHRGSLVLTAGIVTAGAVAAVGRLQAYPALTDDPAAGSGQEAAGHAFAPQLLVICALVGVALGLLGKARSSPILMRQLEPLFRRLLLGGAAALALVFAVGYAARTADADGFAARQLVFVEDWVDRQWDDFMAPGTPAAGEGGSGRVTSGAKGTRSDLYRVALDEFGEHPLRGGGAGSFQLRWMADRPNSEHVLNAHSLEIETLAELGIVGASLLGLFLGALIAAAVRSRVRPGGLARSQVAAVGGACTVWIVHSFVDWDWQVGALTGTVLVLAATLLPYGRVRVRVRRGEAREAPRQASASERRRT